MFAGVSASEISPELNLADVRKLREMWVEAFNKCDMEQVMTFYADDAVELPLNGTPAVHGINAIRESLRAAFANRFAELNVRQTQVGYTEPLAVELATYTVVRPVRNGEAKEEKGRLMATWRRDDKGRFKITICVWSKEAG